MSLSRQYRRTSDRCLFVACGPTGPLAARHRDWGDLVTLNRALEFFADVDLAFFGTGGKVRDTQGHWHKARRFGVLFPDSDPYAKWGRRLPRAGKLRLPLVEFPRESKGVKGGDRLEVIRAHIRAGNLLGRSALALLNLQRLGYTRVWLFGHDGGHVRAGALGMEDSRRGYDKSRLCTEEALGVLGLRYAFYPDPPPAEAPADVPLP